MSAEDVIALELDEDDFARIDALARSRGIGRDAMLLVLVREGLSVCERARETVGRSHGKELSYQDS